MNVCLLLRIPMQFLDVTPNKLQFESNKKKHLKETVCMLAVMCLEVIGFVALLKCVSVLLAVAISELVNINSRRFGFILKLITVFSSKSVFRAHYEVFYYY